MPTERDILGVRERERERERERVRVSWERVKNKLWETKKMFGLFVFVIQNNNKSKYFGGVVVSNMAVFGFVCSSFEQAKREREGNN